MCSPQFCGKRKREERPKRERKSSPMDSAMAEMHSNLFQSLPEECIASMISLTTPPDACRLALVSREFLAASESNIVWERFLPADFDLIVARSDGGDALLAEFQDMKKQLYLRLADRPLLVDAASKSFWLNKSSGKKCWMIAARSLGITWGDTPMYWKWTSFPESRFPEVAQLQSVCWLDINCKIQSSTLSPGTQYAAYLVFRLTDSAYGLEVASDASVRIAGVEIGTHSVYLGAEYEQQGSEATSRSFRGFVRRRLSPQVTPDQFPKLRSDGWRELKIGEFFTHPGEGDEVDLSVREVRDLNWKRGLIVQGIEVRPAGIV